MEKSCHVSFLETSQLPFTYASEDNNAFQHYSSMLPVVDTLRKASQFLFPAILLNLCVTQYCLENLFAVLFIVVWAIGTVKWYSFHK